MNFKSIYKERKLQLIQDGTGVGGSDGYSQQITKIKKQSKICNNTLDTWTRTRKLCLDKKSKNTW